MTRGGSRLVCSDQCSAAFMCLFLRASSLATSVSRQVSCGLYLPGSIGMKSLIGRPNTHIAGDNFVSGSILEDRALDPICIEFPIGTSVVGYEAFDGLHTDFSSAIAMRECN